MDRRPIDHRHPSFVPRSLPTKPDALAQETLMKSLRLTLVLLTATGVAIAQRVSCFSYS